jgi:hypothetical protein
MNEIERLERLERKFERIFKVSFIITTVFAWVYFGLHVIKYVIWG